MQIPYKFKRSQERIGQLTLDLECLENLDETIDSVYQYVSHLGAENGSRTQEEIARDFEKLCPYFGVVWPASRALAEHLASMDSLEGTSQWSGKQVLELGCGLAIPSLVAAKRGARVTATDFHPEVPRFLKKNLELNHLDHLVYLELNWEDQIHRMGVFDWVIGSDILYESRYASSLPLAISQLLPPHGKAIIADPGRPYLQQFADQMVQLGFKYETVIHRVSHGLGTQDVFVLIFER